MKNLQEIAVIHSIDDYAAGMIIEQFFKWTGFSYYIHVYNELDDSLNEMLFQSSNPFDTMIFINDKDEKFKSRFSQLANNSISIDFHDGKFDGGEYLENMPDVIKFLIQVYYKYNLMHILFRNSPIIYSRNDNELLLKHKAIWENILSELKNYYKNIDNSAILPGQEHFDYAFLYCCWKINCFCEVFGKIFEFDSWDLICQVENLHSKYSYNFYILENLIALFSMQSLEFKGLCLSAVKNCVNSCNNIFCRSLYYFQLGKTYKRFEKIIQSELSFENAYKANPLNYKALYQMATTCVFRKYYDISFDYFTDIFKILQVDTSSLNAFLISIKRIPPIELQYVSKSLYQLCIIETKQEHIDYNYLHSLLKLLSLTADVVKKGENMILSSYFEPRYIEILVQDLSNNALAAKKIIPHN